ncbi:MAG: hypothetical protein IPM54_11245 [Polyangiaceae bacterium]|nr:hypothetical protein [Polyangiaceae bacterium]
MAMNWEQAYERWEQKTLKKGKAEGKAEAIVTVLEGRGVSMTATQRKEILECKDTRKLDAWLRKALTASDVDELLTSPASRKRRTTRRAA